MNPTPDPPRRTERAPWSWISGGFAGVIAQAIVNLIIFLLFFFFGVGALEDPFFGSYWWEEYWHWVVAFALAVIAGAVICLFAHWMLSFLLACAGAGLFIAYYGADCADPEGCILTAFLGFGFMIAFAAPSLAAIGLATIRKLIG